MAITIQGIKVTRVSLALESGELKVTGDYELVGPTGMTVAKQNFNGYSDIKLLPTAELLSAQQNLLDAVRGGLNKMLGVE